MFSTLFKEIIIIETTAMWKLDRLLTCKSVDQAQQEKDPASLKKHDCLILLALLSSGLPFQRSQLLALFSYVFFCQYCLAIFEPVFPEEWIFCTSFRTLFFLQQKNTFAPPTTQKEQNSVQLQSSVGISSIQDTQLFFSINQLLATFFLRSTLLALSQKKLKELADVFPFWGDQFILVSLYTFH